MKHFMPLFLLVFSVLSPRIYGQDDLPYPRLEREMEYDLDVALNYLSGLPLGEFKSSMQWNYFPGANLEILFKPAKKVNYWKAGAQLEYLYAGYQSNDYYGLNLKSNSGFVGINFLNRFLPSKSMVLKPYFEFAYGMNINYTNSKYDIVDRATFFERFFSNTEGEDPVEKYTVKKHTAINQNFVIGAGTIIKNRVSLGARYNYVPSVKYVSTRGIVVQNDTVEYQYNKTPVRMITITLGIILSTRNDYRFFSGSNFD